MPRPKAKIDWDRVDKYLKAQCDGVGIAAMFSIHPNTLYEACKTTHSISFSEYSAIKKAEGKELLRMTQYEVATEDKDKTMLVWLGKQYLDQKDKRENENINTDKQVDVNFSEDDNDKHKEDKEPETRS